MSALAGILGSLGLKGGSVLLYEGLNEDEEGKITPWLREKFPRRMEDPHHALTRAFHAALEKTLMAVQEGSPLRIFKRAGAVVWDSLHQEQQEAIETWFQDLRRAAFPEEGSCVEPLLPDLSTEFLQALTQDDAGATVESLRNLIKTQIEQRVAQAGMLFSEEERDAPQSTLSMDIFVEWLADHLDHDLRLRFIDELKPKDGRPTAAWLAYDALAREFSQERLGDDSGRSDEVQREAQKIKDRLEELQTPPALKKIVELLRASETRIVRHVRAALRKVSEQNPSPLSEEGSRNGHAHAFHRLIPTNWRHFGHKAMVEDLVARLPREPRIEIWGPPGIGKTALATEAIRQLMTGADTSMSADMFPDGVVFLDLRRLCPENEDCDPAWGRLADVFDYSIDPSLPARERAIRACSQRRALIVLDGAEQLGRSLEDLVHGVIPPESTLLILTRNEAQTEPDRSIRLESPMEPLDAMDLLRHLAGSTIHADFLKKLQQRLGGHPLALTWAARQLGDDVASHEHFLSDLLSHPFTALTKPAGDVPHTLRWMFDRCVNQLPHPTQAVLSAAARVAEPLDLSLAKAAGGGRKDLKRLVQLGLLHHQARGWRFAHAMALEYSRDLPLSVGLLKKLGAWAVAQLEDAETSYDDSQEAHTRMDQALAHATTVLANDGGGVLEPLYRGLVYLGPEQAVLGLRRGRLDFSQRAMGAAEQWIAQALNAHPEKAALRHEASAVLNRLGELSVAQGDLAAAQRYYLQDKDMAQRQAQSAPDHVEWQHHLSASLHKLGLLAATQNDIQGAARYYLEARDIRERLALQDADHAGIQRDLSISFIKLGDLAVEQGDLRDAVRHYTEAKNIHLRLAQRDPAKAEWQRDLSVSLEKLGDLAVALGTLPVALQHYSEARSIRERLCQNAPDDAGWQRDLSVVLSRLGDVAMAQGDLSGASRWYSRDRDISLRLAQADAANAVWQRDLSVSLEKLGDLAMAQGDLPGALKHYTDSKEIREWLTGRTPAHALWQRDLSIVLSKLGNVAVAQGDLEAAVRHYSADRDIARKLADSSPANAVWQRDLSVSLIRLGDVALAQGELDAADRFYSEARSIRERLTQLDSSHADWQRDLSVSLNKLGDLAAAQDDAPGALRHYTEARKIRQHLARRDPDNAEWQRDLSLSLNKLGDVASDNSALLHYSNAREILLRLTQSSPANAVWWRDLAASHFRLYQLAEKTGDRVLAAVQARESHAVLQAMKDKNLHFDPAMKRVYEWLGERLTDAL